MRAPRTVKEFAELVEKCRKAQRRVQRERGGHTSTAYSLAAAAAKSCEAEVDRAIAAVLYSTPHLPGMEGGTNATV